MKMRSISIVIALMVSRADAGFVNGGFESGFNGYSMTGDAQIATSAFGSGPTQGSSQAILTTAGPFDVPPGSAVDVSTLESFLSLTPGKLSSLTQDPFGVVEGSAIKQTFFANKGDLLKADFNFLTNETLGLPPFDDIAFVTIGSTLTRLAGVFSSNLVTSGTSFADETGFRTFSFTIPQTGTYSLGIGVADVEDVSVVSGLLIDNITLTAVPEPSSLTLVGTGILGLIAYAWRQRRRASF